MCTRKVWVVSYACNPKSCAKHCRAAMSGPDASDHGDHSVAFFPEEEVIVPGECSFLRPSAVSEVPCVSASGGSDSSANDSSSSGSSSTSLTSSSSMHPGQGQAADDHELDGPRQLSKCDSAPAELEELCDDDDDDDDIDGAYNACPPVDAIMSLCPHGIAPHFLYFSLDPPVSNPDFS